MIQTENSNLKSNSIENSNQFWRENGAGAKAPSDLLLLLLTSSCSWLIHSIEMRTWWEGHKCKLDNWNTNVDDFFRMNKLHSPSSTTLILHFCGQTHMGSNLQF
jgi:hypothetical protein